MAPYTYHVTDALEHWRSSVDHHAEIGRSRVALCNFIEALGQTDDAGFLLATIATGHFFYCVSVLINESISPVNLTKVSQSLRKRKFRCAYSKCSEAERKNGTPKHIDEKCVWIIFTSNKRFSTFFQMYFC